MYKHILSESNGAIHKITINRPNQLNALNKETISELGEALQSAEESNEIKVIILTGSGEKAFVALGRNGTLYLDDNMEFFPTQEQDDDDN